MASRIRREVSVRFGRGFRQDRRCKSVWRGGSYLIQAFQELYYKADFEHGGRLPVHVRLIMDEFANIALPDDFERLLATVKRHVIAHKPTKAAA